MRRSRLLRIAAGFAAVCVLPVVASGAGRILAIPTSPASKIGIEIESWLDACPPSGVVPLTLKITNGSSSRHDWTITAKENYGGAVVTVLSVSVDAGKTSEVPFFAAVPSADGANPWRSLYFSVQGHGSSGAGANLQQPATLRPGSGTGAAMPFLVMSSGMVPHAWIALAGRFDKASRSFDAAQVDLTKAPEDWRGYTGIGQLWMTDGEWTGMGTAAKAALLDWLAMGGRVSVFATDTTEARLATMKIPPPGADGARQIGAGKIDVQAWNGGPVPVAKAESLAVLRDGLETMPERLGKYSEPGRFKLPEILGAPRLHAGLIFIFIAVFGVLVGPLNLYWLSKPGRRQRLFWITPLLSIGASLLLIALMILQDGIGGTGVRRVLAIMQPAQNKLALLQEQAARTGVLLGRSFPKQEATTMEKLSLQPRAFGFNPRGDGSAELRDAEDSTGAVVRRTRSGEWFVNRALQAHLLESVTSSRGQIEFFPGASDNDPPTVKSSLDATLDSVFVIDSQNRVWAGVSVARGEPKKLAAAKAGDFDAWLDASIRKDSGPVVQAALNSMRRRAGFAFGSTRDASKFAIRTLDSIRWGDDRVVFAGPYVRHDQP